MQLDEGLGLALHGAQRGLTQRLPGKLDWIFYTGSVLELHNHFVLETRSMTPANRLAWGVEATDTEIASDHAPVVATFET